MRERYLKHGGAYELSTEMKAELNLALPSHWTLDKLTAVQTRIAEPLIVYWSVYDDHSFVKYLNIIILFYKFYQNHYKLHILWDVWVFIFVKFYVIFLEGS